MAERQQPRREPGRRRAGTTQDKVPLIPGWLRVLTVLVVLTPWSVGVMFSILVLKQLPGVAWMAVPSSVIVAVAPAWSLPRRRGARPAQDEENEDGEPETPPPRLVGNQAWNPDQDDDWAEWGN